MLRCFNQSVPEEKRSGFEPEQMVVSTVELGHIGSTVSVWCRTTRKAHRREGTCAYDSLLDCFCVLKKNPRVWLVLTSFGCCLSRKPNGHLRSARIESRIKHARVSVLVDVSVFGGHTSDRCRLSLSLSLSSKQTFSARSSPPSPPLANSPSLPSKT